MYWFLLLEGVRCSLTYSMNFCLIWFFAWTNSILTSKIAVQAFWGLCRAMWGLKRIFIPLENKLRTEVSVALYNAVEIWCVRVLWPDRHPWKNKLFVRTLVSDMSSRHFTAWFCRCQFRKLSLDSQPGKIRCLYWLWSFWDTFGIFQLFIKLQGKMKCWDFLFFQGSDFFFKGSII